MVADAQRATDRMSELLDEVSELARWVRGEHTVNLSRVPLSDIVTAAATSAALPDTAQVRASRSTRRPTSPRPLIACR